MDLMQFELIKGTIKKLLGDDEDSKSYYQTKFNERINDEGIHCIRINKTWSEKVYGSTSMLRDVESSIDRNESAKVRNNLMIEAKASEAAVKDFLLQNGLFPITSLVTNSSLHSNPMVQGKAQKIRQYKAELWIYAYEKLSLAVANDSCIYIQEGKQPKDLVKVGTLKGTDIDVFRNGKARKTGSPVYFRDDKYNSWYKIPDNLVNYYL